MSFAYPAVLILLGVCLPLGVWLAGRAERRRRIALEVFGDPELLARISTLPDRRRSLRRWALGLGALGLGLVALARPQVGERRAELARTGRDVLVLLDLSRSMNVGDAGASRLSAAKRVAWETVSASPGDRVGLVVFGGSAFLQLPLTSDQASLQLFLDAASSDDLGDPATDISAALLTAVRTFEHEGERGRRAVVVLSDGESSESDLDGALSELRREELPVFAIGVGTGAGGPMPADSADAPEKYHRDHIGRVVVSRLEEGELRRVAEGSGGRFARWKRPEELRRLREGLARLETRTLATRQSTERADRFQWPLAAAIVLLVFEMGAAGAGRPDRGPRARGRGLAAGIVVASLSGCFDDARRGVELYESGEYAPALEAFSGAFEEDSAPTTGYNTGNALYRLRRYEEAAKRYRWAAAADSARSRQRSLYNLGNALVRVAEEQPGDAEPLRQAVEAYEEALRLNPTDADAKWNLELALKRLGDDRAAGGSSGRGRAADYGRGDMNVPGYEGNPDAAVGAMAGGGFGSGEGESVEELTQEQARRLLEAVQRQQLTSHEGQPARRGAVGERDW
ncbi:MAG: VWA domain-containing protein [Gemmatimonadales bacterium]